MILLSSLILLERISASHSCTSSSGFFSFIISNRISSISRLTRAIFSSNVSVVVVVDVISCREVRYDCFLCRAINVSEKSTQSQQSSSMGEGEERVGT